jgi:hypothetical protein
MAGLAALTPGPRRPLTVMGEIPAALLAALTAGLRRPLTVMGEIPTALLTALMPGLSRAFTVLGKIASSAAMLGFRISHLLIPLSSGLRFANR